MPTTSPNMGMPIPAYRDPSPGYVTNLASCLTTLDVHDHSGGAKGLPVPTAGLNINADLPFNAHNANNARSYRMVNSGSPLVDAADKNSLYVSGGNLYYNNDSGSAVQLTSGNSINTAATGGIGGDYTSSGASIYYDDTAKKYDFYQGGGTTLASLRSGNVFVESPTPFVDLTNINVGNYFNWRISGSNENLLRVSIDSDLSGAVDATSKYYTSTPDAMVLATSLSGGPGRLAYLGVNTTPLGIGPSSAGSIFAVHNGSGGGKPYTAVFHNPTSQGHVVIGGSQAGSGTRQAAALTWWIPTIGVCAELGALSDSGATATGGAAGDLALRVAGTDSVLTVRYAGSHNIGIGTAIPANRLSVMGAVSIGSNTAAPTNGLSVNGDITGGNVTATSYTSSNASSYAMASSGALVSTSTGARVIPISATVNYVSPSAANVGGSSKVIVPVTLPTGAVVSSASAYLIGNTPGGNVETRVYTNQISSGTNAATQRGATNTTAVTAGAFHPVISASVTMAAGMTLFLEFITDASVGLAALQIDAVDVTYTLPSMPVAWGG